MRTADALHFISTLSAAKMWNAAKLFGSYYYSRLSGSPQVAGLPMTISIEPTTQCNLQCPECPSGLRNFTRPTGSMSLELFQQFLDQAQHHLLWLYFYFQGEPYMNADFLPMVKRASAKKIYTVTSTNAHFLTERKAAETIESGLSRMLISIDGTTQQVYENYRKGGSLDKVLRGTQQLLTARAKANAKQPHLLFQFLVVAPNEHQIDDVKQMAKKYGVDGVVFKTAQLYDFKNGNELMPQNEKYARYEKTNDGSYRIKNALHNHCWKMWHSCVITWDGQLVPCCFDKDAQHSMGKLTTSTLEHIWNSEAYEAFRKSLLKARSEIDMCTNCSEGTRVWA